MYIHKHHSFYKQEGYSSRQSISHHLPNKCNTCTTLLQAGRLFQQTDVYISHHLPNMCIHMHHSFHKHAGRLFQQTVSCVYTCTTASTNMQEGYSSMYTHAPQLPQTCRKVINDKVCMHSCMMMHLHVIVLMFTHLQVCMLLCFVV